MDFVGYETTVVLNEDGSTAYYQLEMKWKETAN